MKGRRAVLLDTARDSIIIKGVNAAKRHPLRQNGNKESDRITIFVVSLSKLRQLAPDSARLPLPRQRQRHSKDGDFS